MQNILVAAAAFCSVAAMGAPSLRQAVIVSPEGEAAVSKMATRMLSEEIEKRSGTRLRQVAAWPSSSSSPVVAVVTGARPAGLPASIADRLLSPPAGAEGFRVQVVGEQVIVAGNSPVGTMFGVGYLLRHLKMARGIVELTDDLKIATSPHHRIRGHQIGYRPKVNTYDAWTPAIFEQYVRDLAVFGTNAIELIPPKSDDSDESPHFLLDKLDMMAEMSRIVASYGLQVWIWFPAMEPDYANPKTVENAAKEWAAIFQRLPRVDAVMVPGGDPGHTQPKYLMPVLKRQREVLRQSHPEATMWVSPQGFTGEWMEEFLGMLKGEPAWLDGLVFGPQVRLTLPELRQRVPARYPIRLYPDITHSVHGEYTVPNWDMAFAMTQGREIPNPRPVDEAAIFRYTAPHTIGTITYSEGVNDDVNKMLWSALGWNPKANVKDVLREFGRYFIEAGREEEVAAALMSLEQNWRGPMISNVTVDTTFAQIRSMERQASPRMLLNWRFQQMLFRAYFDYYEKRRLTYETSLEQQAFDKLREAETTGSLLAMDEADRVLNRAVTQPVARDVRGRMNELAEALYQSIRSQFSVDRYKALAISRGGSLDLADVPLNSRHWLQLRFAELRKRPDELARLAGIEEILHRTDPGPGGFYDDLGNPAAQPHLEPGPAFEEDPASFRAPKMNYLTFGGGATGQRSVDAVRLDGPASFLRHPTSWWSFAEARLDGTISMRYRDLDPKAKYKLRVVYVSRSTREARVRLVANEEVEIHPYISKPAPFGVMDFDVPPAATSGRELRLRWNGEPGVGGTAIGPMIAEVYLVRNNEEGETK